MPTEWTILSAPDGLHFFEILDGDAYRCAVLALAYHSQAGIVPLGLGDTPDKATTTLRALVRPDGRVEWNDGTWPTVEAFLDARDAKEAAS